MQIEATFLETNDTQKIFISKDKCTVGRSAKADIKIDLESFSRIHFEIKYENEEIFITDLHSTNGVFLNHERIPPGVAVKYSNFFPLEVGGQVSFVIQAKQAVEESNEVIYKRPFIESAKRVEEEKGKFKVKKLYILLAVSLVLGIGLSFAPKNLRSTEHSPSIQEQDKGQSQSKLNISISDLDGLDSPDLCEGALSTLCKKVELTRSEEKSIIKGKWMIFYVDTTIRIKEMGDEFLNKVKKEKQIDYILAGFAFNPIILHEARLQELENIIIVGTDLKRAGVLFVNKTPALSNQDYEAIFSNLYYGGIYRPFEKNLASYILFVEN